MKRRQFLAGGLAGLSGLATLSAARAQGGAIRLRNTLWQMAIDPETLKITANIADKTVQVSRGVKLHAVSDLIINETQAAWTWDGTIRLTCDLRDDDLHITVVPQAATDIDLLDQPPVAMGRGLIFPLAEGHYVPAHDATWRDFLLDRVSDIDTSQALSLPLWGLDQGDFTLNWLLLNPFNNTLTFVREGDDLALRLSHSFTRLSPATPMTMILNLGGSDLTSGARRYRRHLIETGIYETLSAKIARTPATAKLIGASHVYLWGNGLLAARDVRDWPSFLKILNGKSPLAVRLRGVFEADALALIKTGGKPYDYAQNAIIQTINEALDMMARQKWQTDAADTAELIKAYPVLRADVLATFGKALAPDPATWGEGLSQRTVAALQKAGLKRLWVGLGDGWEGGLWRPEAVAAFKAAGYLIAPYDSYETAIPPGQRPDWATAQQGAKVYNTCGVVKKNGDMQAGFQRTGYYTNTVCVLPSLKVRVAALAQATGFNSWFLDAYATGMVFDDYRPGHETTMSQHAVANEEASRWISETLGLPSGSEDGNADTAGGVVFGHGMQTPVIGWGDPDLMKDKTSPYYLGDWYPANQPSVFFKPVAMKEPYRTLYFAPETRLPLYQSVFHGSVITTHHWSLDSLKLTNVRAENELAQLLYNVPPLYNLSEGTMKARLPVMARQDAFFRPLHEVLATKTMDGFRWLSDDRRVQETRFSDGSRIIANFDLSARQAEGQTLPPHSVTAILSGQAAITYVVQ